MLKSQEQLLLKNSLIILFCFSLVEWQSYNLSDMFGIFFKSNENHFSRQSAPKKAKSQKFQDLDQGEVFYFKASYQSTTTLLFFSSNICISHEACKQQPLAAGRRISFWRKLKALRFVTTVCWCFIHSFFQLPLTHKSVYTTETTTHGVTHITHH